MQVMHGFWSAGSGMCLWGEDSDLPVTSGSEARRTARPHPFATSLDDLAAVCDGKPGEAVLLLPSLRKAPLDSPELIRISPRPESRSAPQLLPWTVPVLRVDPAAALSYLGELAERPGSEENIRNGASIGYLSDLSRFARELTERGRVLPTVTRSEEGPVASWRAVLQGPDVVALHTLVTAMPPVCRAEPDRDDPHERVTDALHALTDAAVRERLPQGTRLVPARRGRRPKQLPAAEAWLGALPTEHAGFDADEAELAALEESLRPWSEIGVGSTGPARATFRISEVEDPPTWSGPGHNGPEEAEEPAETGEYRWWLEFLLQSTEDPSLLVPAAQAWNDDGSLRRWLDRPQELLLAELGRASRIYPDLETGLRQAQPCGIELNTEGAYRFLSTAAPALDEAGFGVLLPSWWGDRAKLGLKLSAFTHTEGVVDKPSKVGREGLVDFEWQLAVGDDALTEDEIAALAETKAPLVRLRGQWVTVDPEQLQRGLDFLQREPSGTKTVADLLDLAASHPDDVDTPLEVTGVRADGWLGEFLAGTADQTLQPVPLPEHFGAELRAYQQRGLSWLAFLSSLGLGACLADDMGLGKTIQLLALESAHRAEEPDVGPTLLLCPMSLVGNWQREAAKFAPELRVYAHHGASRLRDDALAERLAGSDLVLTTYSTATRDIEELAGYDWHRVVADEAQAIKNSASRAAKAARRIPAQHRIALTGTPLENRLAELWSIMDFVNPGMLGSTESFKARYSTPVERYGEAEPAHRLHAITRPYVLRRLKTDPAIIDDLPEKIEAKQYCKLTTEQASLYQVVVDEMMEKIADSDGIERRGNVLSTMAKLKQVCNHPAQMLHDRSTVGKRSGKVIRLEEILEEILAEGDRVLCFTQFTEFAEMLLPHLSARFGTDVAYLHGGTSRKRRDELVARFQSGDGPPIFLLSLKAGGTGLNLTAANHVIHLDRWWNPAVEDQATDRAFRIGQQRNVEVHKFICTGTLEEKIDDMIEEKKALANLVISDGEGWLTELSTSDLREVFALSEEAVGE